MLRYEHAVRKRENLLKSLQDLRHAITEREAINEFRPAKGKLAHVESTVIAAAESKSIRDLVEHCLVHRFHGARNWQRRTPTTWRAEIERVKNSEAQSWRERGVHPGKAAGEARPGDSAR